MHCIESGEGGRRGVGQDLLFKDFVLRRLRLLKLLSPLICSRNSLHTLSCTYSVFRFFLCKLPASTMWLSLAYVAARTVFFVSIANLITVLFMHPNSQRSKDGNIQFASVLILNEFVKASQYLKSQLQKCNLTTNRKKISSL